MNKIKKIYFALFLTQILLVIIGTIAYVYINTPNVNEWAMWQCIQGGLCQP